MHQPYWAKSQSQHLLPTAIEQLPAAAPARRAPWRLAAALGACGAIFAIDLALPGIVVGLLYCLVLVAVARARQIPWLVVVCGLGTVLHIVAGFFDQPAAGFPIVLANRGLAVLMLWAIGGWIGFNIAAVRSGKRADWRSVPVD
jgi:hypothetical protein